MSTVFPVFPDDPLNEYLARHPLQSGFHTGNDPITLRRMPQNFPFVEDIIQARIQHRFLDPLRIGSIKKKTKIPLGYRNLSTGIPDILQERFSFRERYLSPIHITMSFDYVLNLWQNSVSVCLSFHQYLSCSPSLKCDDSLFLAHTYHRNFGCNDPRKLF